MSFPIVAEAPPIRDADGALRIGQTRVTVETVLWAFQQGSTPEDIVDQFPTLMLADVYDVIAYYLRHRDEIDAYLAAQERSYQQTTAELLSNAPTRSLGRRLRARHPR